MRDLFNESTNEVFAMHDPTDAERWGFFEDLLLRRTSDPPPVKVMSSSMFHFSTCYFLGVTTEFIVYLVSVTKY